LHAILEQLPEGHWTTYQSLADAIGTAPKPLGAHIANCAQCVNAHRVLSSDGTVAAGFKWSAPDDRRDPLEALREEGAFANDHPDPARALATEDLLELIEE